MRRTDNSPLLIGQVKLWWYAIALLPIAVLGWLAAGNHVPALFLPFVLFAFIFWLSSFAMAVIAKLRRSAPESRK